MGQTREELPLRQPPHTQAPQGMQHKLPLLGDCERAFLFPALAENLALRATALPFSFFSLLVGRGGRKVSGDRSSYDCPIERGLVFYDPGCTARPPRYIPERINLLAIHRHPRRNRFVRSAENDKVSHFINETNALSTGDTISIK